MPHRLRESVDPTRPPSTRRRPIIDYCSPIYLACSVYDDLVRGYETDDGKMIVITDREFESVTPEMSADIELRGFVPLEQIPALYFQKPYCLAPSGKSAKAYVLLAATMERSGGVAIGSFVMRGHEYLLR